MPVQVAVGSEVRDDLERVGLVLERSRCALAAVGPVFEERLQHRGRIARLLLHREVRMRVERRCNHLPLRIPVELDQPH